jgi:hypothetical protein
MAEPSNLSSMRKRCAKEGELDTNNIAVPMKLPVIIPSRNAEAIAGNIVAPHGAPLSPLLGVDPQIMYNTAKPARNISLSPATPANRSSPTRWKRCA